VRHRFQHYHKDTLISVDFAKKVSGIDQSLVNFAEKSSQNQPGIVGRREFDALLIGGIVAQYYLQNGRDGESIIQGITKLIKYQ